MEDETRRWLDTTAGWLASRFRTPKDEVYQMLALQLVSGQPRKFARLRVMRELGQSERAHQGPSVEREAVEIGQSVAELTAAEVLDERSWLIVQLRVQHGYTVQQVADQLGISRQRVGQIYNEAIERLREELG